MLDPVLRNADGTFADGVSGNPEGPHRDLIRLKKYARAKTALALDKVEAIMNKGKDDTVTLKAAEIIIRASGLMNASKADVVEQEDETTALSVPQLEALQVKLAAYIQQQRSQPAVVTQ